MHHIFIKVSSIIIYIFVLCGFLYYMTPAIVDAQNLGLDMASGAATTAGFDSATNQTTFATTIGRGIRVLLSFVGIGFTVLVVYSGIVWMTARGNDSQIETSKKTLQNAIIGLLIALSAYSISGFIIQAFETGSRSRTPIEDPDKTPPPVK